MLSAWLLQMCRRSCRRKLVAWSAAAGFVGLLWFANARYLSNFVSGPYTVNESDLVAITQPEAAPRYFVKVDASEMLDTGLQQISVETRNGNEVSRRVSASYYAAVVGERRVAQWGQLDWTASQIEQEVKNPAYKLGGTTITQSFVVSQQFFRFDVSRIDDLLWAYKKVTKHSVNFIPTGKSYAAELVFADRRETVPGSADTVDGLLAHLATRVPWVVFGYDKELESEVKRDPQGFKAAIDERREAWRAQQAQPV